MIIEILQGTTYNTNVDLLLNCYVKTLLSLPPFSGTGMPKQNRIRLVLSSIDKKCHELITFYRTFLSFGNEIIFMQQRSSSLFRGECPVPLFQSH
jgi:hypothetical protein